MSEIKFPNGAVINTEKGEVAKSCDPNGEMFAALNPPNNAAPREIYVEFGGDPSDDKENYKRYCGSEKFEAVGFNREVIHFIEHSAYRELQEENQLLKDGLLKTKDGCFDPAWAGEKIDSLTAECIETQARLFEMQNAAINLAQQIEVLEAAVKFYENTTRLMLDVRDLDNPIFISKSIMDNGDTARQALSTVTKIRGSRDV